MCNSLTKALFYKGDRGIPYLASLGQLEEVGYTIRLLIH